MYVCQIADSRYWDRADEWEVLGVCKLIKFENSEEFEHDIDLYSVIIWYEKLTISRDVWSKSFRQDLTTDMWRSVF